jgi:adenine phosphoribosyltransferase
MNKILHLESKIRLHRDYPKKGILFRDVLPLFEDSTLMSDLLETMCYTIQKDFNEIDTVAGIESRGFIVAAFLAAKLNLDFIPIRKKGKLPGEIIRKTYTLEYGEDTLEIKKESICKKRKILLVDDLLATGGTACAASDLLLENKVDIIGAFFLIELKDLNGRTSLNKRIEKISSIWSY